MAQKAIGPSFYDELAARGGLIGQHFTWSPDGAIEFFEDTPASVVTGVESVYAAHDPNKPSLSSLKLLAKMELDSSDVTITRCAENAVAVPSDWAAYRKALRAVLSESAGDPAQTLPVRPAYPPGT